MSRPTSLIFDIGNVLVTFDFSRAFNRLAQASSLAPQAIREVVMPLVGQMEVGQLSSEAFLDQACTAIGYQGSVPEFRQSYVDIFEENLPMTDFVRSISEQIPCFLLSNTSGLHLGWLEERYEVFRRFRGGAFSHLSCSMKPSPKIYQDAIAATGGLASEALYFDDIAENVAAAQAQGLRAFQYDFKRHGDAEAWLVENGVTA